MTVLADDPKTWRPLPPVPVRQFSFTDFQINHPTAPPPGDRLDGEIDRVNRVIDDFLGWVETSLKRSVAALQDTDNVANDEALAEHVAMDYAVLAQAWAEYMPDTIPPNILAVMGVTGDHWSSRWWANRAAQIVQKGGAVYISDVPPPAPIADGYLWFSASSATLFVWYNDGNSMQWVPAVNTPGPAGPAGPPGTLVEPSIQVSASHALAPYEAGSVFVVGQSAPITITLPAPLAVGHRVMVKDAAGSAGAYPITVAGAGGSLIDDMASYAINYGYGALRVTWSGSHWSLG